MLNYAEAQAAESKKDFIHKMRIGLKELKESNSCLRLLQRFGLIPILMCWKYNNRTIDKSKRKSLT